MGTLPRLIDGNTEFEIKEIDPDTILQDDDLTRTLTILYTGE